MSRRLQAVALIAALPVLLALGIWVGTSTEDGDAGAGNPGSRDIDYEAELADAPPPLAALYAQGNELIPGGLAAFERERAELEGYPVVANLWASWCGPCRAEFPYFQQQSAERGTEVAFLGVNSRDSEEAAHSFLVQLPVPYPSISDPDGEIWNDVGAVGLPATVFYDSNGRMVRIKHGEYRSEDELVADIERYAR